jgi:hypothetical protein
MQLLGASVALSELEVLLCRLIEKFSFVGQGPFALAAVGVLWL